MSNNSTKTTTPEDVVSAARERLWEAQKRLDLLARVIAPRLRDDPCVPYERLSDQDREAIGDFVRAEADVCGQSAGELGDVEGVRR